MKYSLISAAIVAASLLTSNTVLAQEEQDNKHWQVGVGTYAVVIEAEDYPDDDFTGFHLSSTYAFTDNVAVRAQYYSTEHDDESGLDLSGIDVVAFYGTGLLSKGFKAYVGGGFYRETLEIGSFDEDFSGAQINGGIGYNWDQVSLELSIGIRSTGDYEDLIDDSGTDVTAVSSALTVSYRF